MSGQKKNRMLVGALLAATGFGASLVWSQGTPSSAPATSMMAPPTQPAVYPIAVIDDKVINNQAFYDLLMEIAGPRVFEEILNLTIVRTAAEGVGVAETKDPKALTSAMQDEYRLMVNSVPITKEQEADIRKAALATGTAPAPATRPEDDPVFKAKQRVLDNAWSQQGRTLKEIQMVIEQQALLRAMSVVGGLEPKDTEITKAFDRRYGERVTVVLIYLGDNKAGAAKAAAAIKEILHAPNPSVKVARADLEKGLNEKSLDEYKLKATGNVLISRNDKDFGALGAEAFDAKVPEGGVSAVVEFIPPTPSGATTDKADQPKPLYYLLWIEKHMDADKTVKLEDAAIKKELREAVLFEKQNAWMNQRLAELRQRAANKVVVYDKVLLQIFENWRRVQENASTQGAASTVPGLSTTIPSLPPAPAPATTRSATPAPLPGGGLAPLPAGTTLRGR